VGGCTVQTATPCFWDILKFIFWNERAFHAVIKRVPSWKNQYISHINTHQRRYTLCVCVCACNTTKTRICHHLNVASRAAKVPGIIYKCFQVIKTITGNLTGKINLLSEPTCYNISGQKYANRDLRCNVMDSHVTYEVLTMTTVKNTVL